MSVNQPFPFDWQAGNFPRDFWNNYNFPSGTPSSGGGGTDGGGEPVDQGSIASNLPYDPSDPRDFSPTGSGSGVPTQRGIGWAANLLGNIFGVGALTGPLASWATRMIQSGMSRAQVQNAVRAYQQGGGGGGTATGPSGGNQYAGGGGWNPFGGLPAGFTESNRFGGGAPNFQGPGDFGPGWTPGGSLFGETLNLNPNPYGGQVTSSSVPAPGGFGGAFGGSGGTLGGSFGGMFGSQLLRHTLGQGTIPLNAFGQAAGTWTPASIAYWQQHGLPNPSALYGFGSAGGKPGAGLPMRQTA